MKLTLFASMSMLSDVVALEVATSKAGTNYVRSQSSESRWHKTTKYHYSCDGIQSELSEKALRQKIDLYIRLGGISEAEEDHLGKYSIWDVAHIIPMCQLAVCHDHKAGKQGGGAATDVAQSKGKAETKEAETKNESVEKPKNAEEHALSDTANKNDEKRVTGEGDEPEEGKNTEDELSETASQPGENEENVGTNLKENAVATEDASSFSHVADRKDEKQRKAVSRMGTAKGDPVRRLDDNTLSLCISHYLESRCKKQLKGAPNGGETQSMQCFLAQENAEAEAILNVNIQEQLNLVRGKPPCENPEDVLKCDNSATYEKRFLEQILGIDRDLSKAKCESFTSSDENRRKNAWGSPLRNPEWMMPRFRCNYNLMHVTLQARKHRLNYMQSWYAKMENELFRGEYQWFAQTMRSFTGLRTEPTRNTAGRFQVVIERIQKSKRAEGERGTSGNQAVSEKLDDELNILRYLDDEKYVPKSGIDIYNPTHQKYTLASWNFRVSERDTDSFMSSRGDERKEDEKDVKSVYWSLVDANIDLPAVIGKTRWLDFLQSTRHWDPSFWQLISPANFARMTTQKELTKALCRKLTMEDKEYRTPGASQHVVKKQKYQDHFGQHSATDFGTCSLPLIVSRLEAAIAARAEADVPTRTATYVPPPGEISPVNNALAENEDAAPNEKSEAFPAKSEHMQYDETNHGAENSHETDEENQEGLPQNMVVGPPTTEANVSGPDAESVPDATEGTPDRSESPEKQNLDGDEFINDNTAKSMDDDLLTKEQNLEEKRRELRRKGKLGLAILVGVCLLVLALVVCFTKCCLKPLADTDDADADNDHGGGIRPSAQGGSSVDQTSAPPPFAFVPFASEVVPPASVDQTSAPPPPPLPFMPFASEVVPSEEN
eukprot:GEMP01004907.1.p1 GENE.GEMP01004907.1~~GEMP01004907.1.p1  ORF type:complete len:891 (+),score=173.63 GEMP01004907.1:1137-3809(+)